MFKTAKSRLKFAVVSGIIIWVAGFSTLGYFLGIEGIYGFHSALIIGAISILILASVGVLALIACIIFNWIDSGE